MLELHEICLKPEDKQKIKRLCEVRSNQVKYRDALALIHVNRDLNADGSPVRGNEGFWVLQIPQRKKDRSSSNNRSPNRDGMSDTKSVLSNMSAYTDVSIDPIIRQKAEKILEYQRDTINLSQLQTIKEEGSHELMGDQSNARLNVGNLRTLDNKGANNQASVASLVEIKSKHDSQAKLSTVDKADRKGGNEMAIKDMFEAKSRWEENSMID